MPEGELRDVGRGRGRGCAGTRALRPLEAGLWPPHLPAGLVLRLVSQVEGEQGQPEDRRWRDDMFLSAQNLQPDKMKFHAWADTEIETREGLGPRKPPGEPATPRTHRRL